MLKFYEQGKVLLYIKQLEAKYPVFLEVHPSLSCNHLCVWCRYGRSDNKLSYDFMIGKLVKYPHVKGIRITGGGEPLSNKNTIKFIKECYNRGIKTGIETNGGLLTDEAIDVISRNCRYCRISLDAATAKTHRLLHRSDDFDTVIDNIKKLREAKVGELGISYLVVAKNVAEIPLLEKLNLPVDYIHFKPLIEGIDTNTKNTAIKRIQDSPYFEKVRTRYDRLLQDDVCNRQIPCRISNLIRVIGGDGKEYACCEHAYETKFEVGMWDGDATKCTSCRYNGYNEILESYYAGVMAREFL